MHDPLSPWSNPITYAVPFFLISIALELAALKWLDHDDNVTGYYRQDAQASILMGLGSLVSSTVFKLGSLVVYVLIYDIAPFHLPTDVWWSWMLMIAMVDLAYYWQHRFVHRARVGWAAHQAHHSSSYMNFATALRQKWNPWFEFFFFAPLPLLGVAPWAIFFAYAINLIYQFFVHTETIDRLPRPFELVFNTPSHHRVHHGSDPEYLDKNYAGILIIWDRMFGSFTPEVQRPTYGLTHDVTTFNLITLEYGDYAALFRDVRAATTWRTKLGYLFRPPGWTPPGTKPGEGPTPSPTGGPRPSPAARG
jgi:sterol desaturase/sphingolipid hydroxylase (fatty acid hydroxylase superfamily)